MSNKHNFFDFVDTGFVSVWVGDFRSEELFDSYLRRQFEADFNFRIRPQSVHEIRVESEPIEIAKLVDGFSRSKTFDTKLTDLATERNITTASSMLIIYQFKYDSDYQTVPNAQLKFIGAVPYPGFE